MTYEHLRGLRNVAEISVTAENTALALGSGSLKVFATPCRSSNCPKIFIGMRICT